MFNSYIQQKHGYLDYLNISMDWGITVQFVNVTLYF